MIQGESEIDDASVASNGKTCSSGGAATLEYLVPARELPARLPKSRRGASIINDIARLDLRLI